MSKTKLKPKSIIRMTVMLFLFAIMFYSLYHIGIYFWDNYQNIKLNNELQETYYLINEENQDEDRDHQSKFKLLLELNPDVIGWVKIAGTKIDNPVVKTDNNYYYLNHNIKKEVAPAGTIFMDYRNESNGEDRNTIIYGHHMKDGSMFKGLVGYKEKDFYKKHPIIELDTLQKDMKYEIFSAYITDTGFDYTRTEFSNDEEYEEFLKEIKSRSLYDTGLEVSKEGKILTLSTCTYEFDDARFTVHAKLVENALEN